MSGNATSALLVSSRWGLPLLIGGRVSLILCSVLSIRLATTLLGPAEMGTMNLILSAVNLFALMVGAFSLFFYRQIIEWHREHRLLDNLARYSIFLIAAASAACACIATLQAVQIGPWQVVSTRWLVLLLAGNLVLTTLCAAILYALNVMGHRSIYVLLSNLASWGGVGLAVVATQLASARAEHWLAGLLGGQTLAMLFAYWALLRSVGETRHSTPAERMGDDFRFRAVVRFSWPLMVCTGLYWVQRNSFAPLMAWGGDVERLGLFSVALSVGLLVMASFDTLCREYFSPIYYHAIAGADDGARVAAWNAFASALFPATLVMLVFVCTMASWLLRILVSDAFHGLSSVVLWGAASQALIAVYSTYVMLASTFMDNRILLLPNLAGAAVVLVLLWFLLPLEPFAGTGLSIAMGLLVTTLLTAYQLQRRHRLTLPLRRMAVAMLLALPLVLLAFATRDSPWSSESRLPHVLGVLSIALIYLALVQYRLALPWLR